MLQVGLPRGELRSISPDTVGTRGHVRVTRFIRNRLFPPFSPLARVIFDKENSGRVTFNKYIRQGVILKKNQSPEDLDSICALTLLRTTVSGGHLTSLSGPIIAILSAHKKDLYLSPRIRS